ncbi:hypothetical protein AMTR_s00121p00124870 [Amborella trichopoda]|uniref:Uncharacterized protein n=1 Tax=Amborella trichopoda TaxID=13333 RepID=W1NQK2_AMBTC|nr:hypothetical protein AMTR_s00121p00124870 [Amborella trichopoda]
MLGNYNNNYKRNNIIAQVGQIVVAPIPPQAQKINNQPKGTSRTNNFNFNNDANTGDMRPFPEVNLPPLQEPLSAILIKILQVGLIILPDPIQPEYELKTNPDGVDTIEITPITLNIVIT